MKKFSLLFISLLIFCIYTITNGSPIINLLENDSALFDEGKLNDENFKIVQFWYGDSDEENDRRLRMKRSDRTETWYIDEAPIIRERMPVWLVYNATTIIKADENIISDAIKIYQEPQLVLSLVSKFDKYNHRYFTGSISKMTIAPLSNNTATSILKEKPHLFKNTLKPGTVDETNNLTISGYHLMYEPKNNRTENIILPPMGSPELFRKSVEQSNGTSHNRLKRSILHTVYPEILAVLDYGEKYTSIYELRFLDLLAYTINFWNSVNLRFKALRNPRVQLKLTGILVSMERWAIPPLDQSYSPRGVKAQRILAQIPQWLKQNIPNTYDICVIHTNLPLCLNTDPECVRNIQGLAYYAASCRQGEGIPLPAVIHDDINYEGLRAAIHEIGHILGADHDTSSREDECAEYKGYIMAEIQNFADHQFSWSPCSYRELSNHLRSSMTTCYHNENPSDEQGDLVELLLLPGTRVSLEKQCTDRRYGSLCYSHDVCKSVRCTYLGFICIDSGPALDGSPCRIGECRMGACVPSLSNLTSNLKKLSPLAYLYPPTNDIEGISDE